MTNASCAFEPMNLITLKQTDTQSVNACTVALVHSTVHVNNSITPHIRTYVLYILTYCMCCVSDTHTHATHTHKHTHANTHTQHTHTNTHTQNTHTHTQMHTHTHTRTHTHGCTVRYLHSIACSSVLKVCGRDCKKDCM